MSFFRRNKHEKAATTPVQAPAVPAMPMPGSFEEKLVAAQAANTAIEPIVQPTAPAMVPEQPAPIPLMQMPIEAAAEPVPVVPREAGNPPLWAAALGESAPDESKDTLVDASQRVPEEPALALPASAPTQTPPSPSPERQPAPAAAPKASRSPKKNKSRSPRIAKKVRTMAKTNNKKSNAGPTNSKNRPAKGGRSRQAPIIAPMVRAKTIARAPTQPADHNVASVTPAPSANVAFPPKMDDSRQAFAVLAWFEFLLKRVPVAELPYLIDQYRTIGWIDDGVHAWFQKMAQGVGAVRSKAGETQFARQNARRLVTIHKETLRFLKQLREATPKAPNHQNGAVLQQPIARKK